MRMLAGGIAAGLALVVWRPGWESVAVLAIVALAGAYAEWCSIGAARMEASITKMSDELEKVGAQFSAVTEKHEAALKELKEHRDRLDALSRPRKMPSI